MRIRRGPGGSGGRRRCLAATGRATGAGHGGGAGRRRRRSAAMGRPPRESRMQLPDELPTLGTGRTRRARRPGVGVAAAETADGSDHAAGHRRTADGPRWWQEHRGRFRRSRCRVRPAVRRRNLPPAGRHVAADAGSYVERTVRVLSGRLHRISADLREFRRSWPWQRPVLRACWYSPVLVDWSGIARPRPAMRYVPVERQDL